MKRKTVLTIVLLAFLFPAIFTAAIMPPAKAFTPLPVIYLNPLPDFYLDPSTIQVASGLLFNVNLYVNSTNTSPALNLEGWEASLQWDSNVLSLVSVASVNSSYGLNSLAINSSVPEQTSQRFIQMLNVSALPDGVQVTSPLELMTATFQGISVGSSSINLVDVLLINSTNTSTTTYDRSPDVNGDGVVNMRDISWIIQHYLTTPSSPNWDPNCDIDDNGVIDFMDLAIVVHDFNKKGVPGFIIPSPTVLDFAANIENSSVTVSAGVHDVGVDVAPLSRTVIGRGFGMDIPVNVANEGTYTETINVTAYANTTTIASENITLPSGPETINITYYPNSPRIELETITLTSENLSPSTLTWNTTGFDKGNYTISASAEPVPGETNTADNSFTDGWIIVSLIGDVGGNSSNISIPDGRVDMKDIAIIDAAFGSNSTWPDSYLGIHWNPNADVNVDGRVDMKDIAWVDAYFGQIDP